jgi:hypothetical protein
LLDVTALVTTTPFAACLPAQHEVSASVLKASIDLLPFFAWIAAAAHESQEGKRKKDERDALIE